MKAAINIINVSDVLLILIKILDERSDRNFLTTPGHNAPGAVVCVSVWDLCHIRSVSNIRLLYSVDACANNIDVNTILISPSVAFQCTYSLINNFNNNSIQVLTTITSNNKVSNPTWAISPLTNIQSCQVTLWWEFNTSKRHLYYFSASHYKGAAFPLKCNIFWTSFNKVKVL